MGARRKQRKDGHVAGAGLSFGKRAKSHSGLAQDTLQHRRASQINRYMLRGSDNSDPSLTWVSVPPLQLNQILAVYLDIVKVGVPVAKYVFLLVLFNVKHRWMVKVARHHLPWLLVWSIAFCVLLWSQIIHHREKSRKWTHKRFGLLLTLRRKSPGAGDI